MNPNIKQVCKWIADGEEVQFHCGNEWKDLPYKETLIIVPDCLYRLKPKTKKIWVSLHKSNSPGAYYFRVGTDTSFMLLNSFVRWIHEGEEVEV